MASERELGSPLKGVRVVDLTRLLPGPFATLLLADLGADVIKVEDPRGGDYARYFQPFIGEMGALFASVNRNKRSVAVNLKTAAGLSILERLLVGADVLIESFRPGVLARLGLDDERLATEFADLIVCSISGYGQSGPAAFEAGHDINYLARAGLLHVTGSLDGTPIVPGFQLADIGAGALYATSAILAALYKRERGGGGSRLDISMTDGALSFALPMVAMSGAGQPPRGAGRDLLNGGVPCYGIYATADGYLAVGALEPKFWMAFCTAVGLDRHLGSGLSDGEAGNAARNDIAAHLAAETTSHWLRLLDGADCCVAEVRRPDETLDDPLFVERDVFFTLGAGDEAVVHTATPLTPSDRDSFRVPPRLGEHTAELLEELGFDSAEQDGLRSAGVIAVS